MVELCIIVGVAGASLVLWSFRGRAVGDHPYCIACGYDLFGVEGTVSQCPECGADLGEPGAVRVGRRQRSKRLLAAGLVLILLSLVACGPSILQLIYRNSENLKPLWLVRMQAEDGSDRALNELIRRAKANELSTAQSASMVSQLLQFQADKERAWNPKWGDLMETFQLQGLVNATDWAAYINEAVSGMALYLEVDQPVSADRGDVSCRIGYEKGAARLATWTIVRLDISYDLRVTESEQNQSGVSQFVPNQGARGWRMSRLSLGEEYGQRVGDNVQTLYADLSVAVSGGGALPVFQFQRTITTEFRVVPPHVAANQIMAACMSIPFDNPRVENVNDEEWRLTLYAITPSVNCYFQVFLIHGGKNISVGDLPLRRNGGSRYVVPLSMPDGFDAESVDLRLLPTGGWSEDQGVWIRDIPIE